MASMKRIGITLGVIALLVVVGVGIWYHYFRAAPRTPSPVTFPNGQTAQTNAPASTPSASATPAEFAADFYRWYIYGLSQDHDFTSSSAYTSTESSWLTPEFIAGQQAYMDAHEVSPVLLSQDYGSSWLTNIQASEISETDATAAVLISLGTGDQLKHLQVGLTKVNGGWRIATITKSP